MPIVEGSNTLSTEDWLAITREANIALMVNYEPTVMNEVVKTEPMTERAFGTHLSEAATTLKKLFAL